MDGEEDDFMPGNHSDEGGGTPVQDEHPPSDGEEMRSDGHQSEDDGGDKPASRAMEVGVASGSDHEDGVRPAGGEEGEGGPASPAGRRGNSPEAGEGEEGGHSDSDTESRTQAENRDSEGGGRPLEGRHAVGQ
ncbi:uncharacterized protein ACNS7B_014991 [Menidia menidia]